MQELLTEINIEKAKISTKGIQKLIIIPKDKHQLLKKLEDKPYLLYITIKSLKDKKTLYQTTIIAKISVMGEQKQIYIPLDIHNDIKDLKDKYAIKIVIRERS